MVWSTVPYCASEKASVTVTHIGVSQPTSALKLAIEKPVVTILTIDFEDLNISDIC